MKYGILKRTCIIVSCLLVLGICVSSYAQVKINEIGATWSGVQPDDNKFIELFGPGFLNIGTYEIALVNGQTETDYAIIDLAGKTIPADGYFVVSWNATKVPNTDLELSAGQTRINNNSPTAVVLRQKFNKTTMDAVGFSFRYNTEPGTGSPGALTQGKSFEGNGSGVAGQQTFNVQVATTTTVRSNATFGRLPDGTDTGNNYDDFMMFYKGAGHAEIAGTPGQSNWIGITAAALPLRETFEAGLTREWIPTHKDIEFETAAVAQPVAIPDSPDNISPANWASVKNSVDGGGDQAIMGDFAAVDYDVTGAFYCGPISAAVGHEVGIFGGRTAFSKNHDDDTNVAPIDPAWHPGLPTHGPNSYQFQMDYVTGMIRAVKLDKNQYTQVAETGPVPAGWHKLEINFNGPVVTWYLNGSSVAQLNSELPRPGYVVVGYREAAAGNGSVRNNFDNIMVRDASQSGINDWSVY